MSNSAAPFEVVVKTSAVVRKKDGRVIDYGVISESKHSFLSELAEKLFPQAADELKEKS